MAKLTRESRLRERRLDKQARKNARKYAAAHPEEFSDTATEEADLLDATGEADPSVPQSETDRSGLTDTHPAVAEAGAQISGG